MNWQQVVISGAEGVRVFHRDFLEDLWEELCLAVPSGDLFSAGLWAVLYLEVL